MPMPRRIRSAGVVIVRRYKDREVLFLVLRAFGYWDFPKGLVEAEEEETETAKREAAEEAGLHDLKFSWGDCFIDTEAYGRDRKIARYFIAETRKSEIKLPISAELGRPEHDEWRWATLEEAQELFKPRLIRVLLWADQVIRDVGTGDRSS